MLIHVDWWKQLAITGGTFWRLRLHAVGRNLDRRRELEDLVRGSQEIRVWPDLQPV